MICRTQKIQNIFDKIAVKQKKLNESKNLHEIKFLSKEIKDLKLILYTLVDDNDK